MVKVVIHAHPSIEWQMRYAKYAVEGLKRHNVDVSVTHEQKRQPCDVAILMGPNLWIPVERTGQPYLMFNRKFVGNDPKVVHENCAIGWDGFNGNGTFCVDEVNPSRLLKYLNPDKEFEEWQKGGKNIILCDQSNIGRSTKFATLQQFFNYVQNTSDDKVIFRKKPSGEHNISYERFKQEVRGAKAAVVLNSTVSLEFLTAGIPVISLDDGDAAYPITSHKLSELVYPNRLPFFQYLAHCQWHYTEIQNGEFWTHVYPKRGIKLNEWKNQ